VKKRLFLAVSFSVPVTRRLAEAALKMRPAADKAGIRASWAPSANLHVTLKFLGWTNADVVDAVRDRVREAAAGRKGFDIGARGVGAFPDENHPSVLWIGVTDAHGALKELAETIDVATSKLGFARETRPFHPHVTVARVREGRGGLAEVFAPFRQTDFGQSLVREVVLYESITKSKGSEYVALFRIPLEAAPPRAERQTREVEEGSTSEDANGGPTGESDRARRQLD